MCMDDLYFRMDGSMIQINIVLSRSVNGKLIKVKKGKSAKKDY